MKIFLNVTQFISVIRTEDKYSCQVMDLIHGNGCYTAYPWDDNQEDIISAINHNYETKIFDTLEQVVEYHRDVLLEMEWGIPEPELEYPFS